ncbi:hypothetical protein EMMF5_001498 [Cystobasidiomycetes sp. EMM_F5]
MSYVLDRLPPSGRAYLALGSAFFVATILRNLCFNPRLPIFGPDLARELAPIERDDVSYLYIVAIRLWDLTLAVYVWSRETNGHKRRADAPFLGVLLCLLARVPLYLLLSHHFLLSHKTLGQVLVTDIFASSAALWNISKIEPKAPAFFKSPSSESPIQSATRSRVEMAFYAIGISTFINALFGYISERMYLQSMIRNNVLDVQMPAYLSAAAPSFAEALKHPSIAVPILRSAVTPQSMPTHILSALPLSLISLVLGLLYLPKKSPASLAGLAFLLTAPTNALSTFNLLPIKPLASAVIGLENGTKAAIAAFVVAWATEEWRKPATTYSSSSTAVLKDVSGDVDELIVVSDDTVTITERIHAEEDS